MAPPDAPPTHEWWRLAFALTGAAEPPAWDRVTRAYDLDDAKGLIELVCRRLGYAVPAYEPLSDDPNLHPGRAARVSGGGKLVGRVGELHPATIEALDLRADRVLVAELAVAGLAAGRPATPRVVAPSRHPSVERDLAIIVAEDRAAADVVASIRRHGGPLLRDVVLFDVYRGKPLDETEKSLAWRLTFAGEERTLTENEVDDAVAVVTDGLARDVGGHLRS